MLAEGFFEVLPAKVLRADSTAPSLRALDLELLCAGLPGIDLADWRKHTLWQIKGKVIDPCAESAGGNGEFPYLLLHEAFWEVLGKMDAEDHAKVLSFACGSGRLPAGGFRSLQPPFNVELLVRRDRGSRGLSARATYDGAHAGRRLRSRARSSGCGAEAAVHVPLLPAVRRV